MVGGAAGDDVQPVQPLQLLPGEGDLVQHHFPVPQAGENGIPQGLGLLHDLLEHKVLIAPLFRGRDLPIYMGDLLLHRLEQGVVHLGPMGGKHRHFPILQAF